MVSEAGKTLKLLKSSEVHRLAYLFRNAHAIAKQNRLAINGCAKLTNTKGLTLVILTKQSMRLMILLAVQQNRVFSGDAEYVVAFQVFFRPDKFSFGQTVFLNCLTECQTNCLGFSICLGYMHFQFCKMIYFLGLHKIYLYIKK